MRVWFMVVGDSLMKASLGMHPAKNLIALKLYYKKLSRIQMYDNNKMLSVVMLLLGKPWFFLAQQKNKISKAIFVPYKTERREEEKKRCEK